MNICQFCAINLPLKSPRPLNVKPDVTATRQSLSKVIETAKGCDLCKLISSRLETRAIAVKFSDQYEIGTTKFCYSEPEDGDPYDWAPIWESSRVDIKLFPAIETSQAIVTGFSGPLLPCEFDEAAKEQPHSILQLQLCTNPEPPTGDGAKSSFLQGLHASGRRVHDKANLNLFSQWIQLCKIQHGGKCLQSIWPLNDVQELQSLLVIDVEKMCITDAPQGCRYVALSYCWGTVPVIKHLRSNSAQLRQEGGLQNLTPPKTISDAITVVRGVGERYLWVDALCIIQDDPVVQKVQLGQMGLIYSLAAFTITAAAGADANAGLPGVRSGSREIHQDILQAGENTYLTVIDGPFYGGVRESTWIKRAWTMQEKILSKRNLIFTQEQVYWTCWSATWLEEVALEEEMNVHFFQAPTKVGPADLSFSSVGDELSLEELYQGLVNAYLQRQLSFEADILNGFSGICQTLIALSQVSFFWGIPKNGFGRSLAWTLRGGGTRNHASCLLYDTNHMEEKVKFPSWSWAAWFGSQNQAWISWFGAYESGDEDPEVIFYGYDGERRLTKFDSPAPSMWYENESAQRSLESVHGLHLNYRWRGQPRSITEEMIAEAKCPLNYGHVLFWTSVAQLAILRSPQRALSTGSAATSPYSIFPKINSHVRLETTSHIPFRHVKESLKVPKDIIREARCGDTEDCFVRDFIVIGRDEVQPTSLMTLVVEWTDGVAYRIGIASIDEKEWIQLKRSWKLVTLG
jgi:hypothetical protein